MNLNNPIYSQFELCKEMIETTEVIRNFDPDISMKYLQSLQKRKKLLLTGEGSSRLLPAKHRIYQNSIRSCGVEIWTEGAAQALEYELTDFALFGVSNSCKTNELITLFNQLKISDHDALFGLTANDSTLVQALTHLSTLLKCGSEKAVATTKSMVEQTMFYHSLYLNLMGEKMDGQSHFADMFQEMLEIIIDRSLVKKLIEAPVIYFSGRNNGVAEEVVLKTNEIARKHSSYLEGTYVVHGIEEVLNPKDVVIIFDPFIKEEEKFKKLLVDIPGIEVITISSHQTLFNTIQIPDAGIYQ
jgi:glutamine---fructose-6-phosphate transaminase (isomerizing)